MSIWPGFAKKPTQTSIAGSRLGPGQLQAGDLVLLKDKPGRVFIFSSETGPGTKGNPEPWRITVYEPCDYDAGRNPIVVLGFDVSTAYLYARPRS